MLVFFLMLVQGAKAQVVFQPTTSGVYDFLDEMAGLRVIELNSAVKPYSRLFIAQQLQAVQATDSGQLSRRQRKELAFYMRDFYKDIPATGSDERRVLRPLRRIPAQGKRFNALFYRDSLLTITVNPIIGGRVVANDANNTYHRYAGAEAWAYAGPHLGIYANYRDNRQRLKLSDKTWLTQEPGVNYKEGISTQGTFADFSEARGGITYGWKWGYVGIVKEYAVWGNNYNGANILSGHAPSFAQLKLNLKPAKWIELNYLHGWLVSGIIDSSRSYTNLRGQQREVYRDKYIATNLITFKPFKGLFASVGNSIIYADQGVNPAYLLPVMFYKSVDHALNGLDSNTNNVGQNSQIFFDISSRQLKHVHAFLTVFSDEISLTKAFDKQKNSNFLSFKLGGRLNDLGLRNLSLIGEYTRTNPYTYQHHNQTTTYESNGYNLGHYLRGNAEEVYLAARYKPFRASYVQLSYTNARKGPEPVYGVDRLKGYPFLAREVWSSKTLSAELRAEVINDGWAWLQISNTAITDPTQRFSASWMRGTHTTVQAGLAYGF